MRPLYRNLSLLICLTLPSAHPLGAQAYHLDFSGLGLSNNSVMPNTYGDVAGKLDITYQHRSGWGDSDLLRPQAYFWDRGYNELVDVLWSQPASGVGEVKFVDLMAGSSVTFNSANVGAWFERSIPVELRVYDGSWSLLYSRTASTATLASVLFTPAVSSQTLYVQWSGVDIADRPVDAANVGIDNLDFNIGDDITPTPEPASFLLLATGIVAIGGLARRRNVR